MMNHVSMGTGELVLDRNCRERSSTRKRGHDACRSPQLLAGGPLLSCVVALALGMWLGLAIPRGAFHVPVLLPPPVEARTPSEPPQLGPGSQAMALVVTHSGGPGPYTLHDPRLGLALSRARGVEASERGPRIVIISPEEGKVHSAPLDIDIRFEPQDGSPIDLSTLKVTYGKLVCIDLTSRVLPYASPEGIRVHQALFPAGTHTITIAIADRQGTLASRTLTIALR